MDDILIINEACKSFGALRAIWKLSISVRKGEIFGIAGPNGSGKTTLFNMITCIPFRSDSGQIIFDGKYIERKLGNDIAKLGIARTFQRETAFGTLSTLQNVLLGASYGKINSKAQNYKEDSANFLRFVGINDSQFDRRASDLSVFDKKRLMLASALAMKPKILLLDEPASGLTKPEISETVNLVRRINENGVTVVVIEHVLTFLLTLSDRIMILNQGQMLFLGKPYEVVKDSGVIEAYLGSRTKEWSRY